MIQDIFGKQIQHKMEEPSKLRQYMLFDLIKSVSTPCCITVNYINFTLVLWKPKFFNNFLNKPYLNNSAVTLWPNGMLSKS